MAAPTVASDTRTASGHDTLHSYDSTEAGIIAVAVVMSRAYRPHIRSLWLGRDISEDFGQDGRAVCGIESIAAY